MTVKSEIQIDSFRHSLVETITWCELTSVRPPVARFRSPELNPEGNLDCADDSYSRVETVCRRRSELLRERQSPLVDELRKDGRLLVFYPCLTLFDGAAELSSDGYFNFNNEPPWDTWIYFGQNPGALVSQDYHFFLVSWVSKSYLAIAQRGIDVNPEGCIEWFGETAKGISADCAAKIVRLLN